MTAPRLTIRSIRAVGVEVPMSFPLGTSAATLRSAPLLLIDLETEEGITGHAYLFCYVPAAAVAIAAFANQRARERRAETAERSRPPGAWSAWFGL